MSSATLVLQSHRAPLPYGWLSDCVASVRRYAEARGYAYRWFGDELFDLVPSWYREKTAGRTPVTADLARLLAMHDLLETGVADQAIWLDADVLLFAPERLVIPPETSGAFGYEIWVEQRDRRLRTHRSYHNALCVFRRGCPVLAFLIHAIERIIERAEPDRIAPQMVGPKLLSALGNTVGFERIESVGALSPDVLVEIADGGGPALDRLRSESVPLAGANLCASLASEVGEETLPRVVEVLLEGGWQAPKAL